MNWKLCIVDLYSYPPETDTIGKNVDSSVRIVFFSKNAP